MKDVPKALAAAMLAGCVAPLRYRGIRRPANSLHGALRDQGERDAALITFLVTASGLTLVGIGSVFWGLLFVLVVLKIRPSQQA